ncbi:pentapeptide repeat-containing protein [Methylobacterium sp. PvR107]|uniref:pentapeptide repeat-containing protein n=1 Tax=Methylobacterium sp. PvR107 TaxID=2806597 RepID=UPI001AE19D4B|nr:pentapeptide repeat-containing protein [Methylobacterium sp. PvR107]MBP1182164.1 hypothetical protein [Methylobacterium sp. PvR107]
MSTIRVIALYLLVVQLVSACGFWEGKSALHSTEPTCNKYAGKLQDADQDVYGTEEEIEKLLVEKECYDCVFRTGGNAINLVQKDLEGARLTGADFANASLYSINLKGAHLASSNFTSAHLQSAHLEGSDLTLACLRGAKLSDAYLKSAKMFGADVSEATFEVEPDSLPDVRSMDDVKGLKTLQFRKNPAALLALRKAFDEAGMRRQVREITYAFKKGEREKELSGTPEGLLWYYLVEFTSDWGAAPFRPLLIIAVLLPAFSLIYFLLMLKASEESGVWLVPDKDHITNDNEDCKPVLLQNKGWKTIFYAGHFSILSAFAIGWKDINVGNWINRLAPFDYTIKGTGWVKSLSGLQSLISVYMLALSLLVYFGRPFE